MGGGARGRARAARKNRNHSAIDISGQLYTTEPDIPHTFIQWLLEPMALQAAVPPVFPEQSNDRQGMLICDIP